MLGFLAAAAPALIGGIMGGARQASQDRASKRAAEQQNKEAKIKAQNTYERAVQEYELDW